MIFVEEYYKLMAQLLVKLYSKDNNWNEVVKYYEDNFKKSFTEMRDKVLEDNLFADIKQIVGEQNAKVIVPLLD